jgi:phosphatidate cytidylyltransferase
MSEDASATPSEQPSAEPLEQRSDSQAGGLSRESEPLHPKPPSELPESEKQGMSELARRGISAAILVPLVLYVIAVGGLPYLAIVMGFILLAQREFYGLIEDKGAQPHVGLGLGAAAAVTLLAYFGGENLAMLLMTVLLLALMVAQLRKAQIHEALSSISGTFFGVFYVGWLLSHAIVLRRFYDAAVSRYSVEEVLAAGYVPDSGAFFMIFTLVVVVLCDTGAYFAGRQYGRRKLAPKVSPGKTVEGAVGGLLAGILGGLATKGIFDFFWPDLSASFSWEQVVPFAIVLSIVGIVGDLVESLLKRDAAVKDAGSLLPGMGGILDRVDAPILAIPVMYYMLLGSLYLRI